MKSFPCLLFLLSFAVAHAEISFRSTSSAEAITIGGGRYELNFGVSWRPDDLPQSSRAGQIDLLGPGGNFIGRLTAITRRGSSPSVSANFGSVDGVSASIVSYAGDGTPADGDLTGSWHLSGLANGNYTLRFYSYETFAVDLVGTTVWTNTYSGGGFAPPPANQAPTIRWNATPGTVASGQTYSISAHGHDDDGNLMAVNVWRDGAPYAFAGGGNGTDGDSGNPSTDTGPVTITYTANAVDTDGITSATIAQTVLVSAPATVSATITASPASAPAPGATTISWSSANAHSVAVGGSGLGSSAPSGSQTVGGLGAGTYTYTVTAQGAGGPVTRTATFTVTAAPTATLTTLVSPAGAGAAAGGGTFPLGTGVTVTASPGSNYVFTGWTGDVSSGANPLSFTLNANVRVTANFTAAGVTLTTAAGAGGSVTPGGTYPAGTVVTLAATPDASSRFTGWSGDAAGGATTTAVTLDRAKFVQANFTGRASQMITFPPPGNRTVSSPPFALTASASSGLPVGLILLGGPATLTGGSIEVTGPGAVTVQATQPGDAFYLPAAPVTQSFNVTSAATVRYQPRTRTLLHEVHPDGTSSLVIQGAP